MRYRPRWGLLTLGAIMVIALFTYPLWRTFFTGGTPQIQFPLVSPEQRAALLGMPNREIAATAYVSMLTVVPVPTEVLPPPIPADATILLTGTFTILDPVRGAQGKVTIFRLIDDSVIMRFDDFRVTNAPNLVVFLSANEAPKDPTDLGGVASEWLAGELSGTDGAQQFVIPRELRLEPYRTVVVVSESLGMIYSVAKLE